MALFDSYSQSHLDEKAFPIVFVVYHLVNPSSFVQKSIVQCDIQELVLLMMHLPSGKQSVHLPFIFIKIFFFSW